MSTCVNMMCAAEVEPGLLLRLERLTGTDGACCIPEYVGDARSIQKAPEFAVALARARALSDPGRLTAVSLLRRTRELCACEIQAALGVGHATVSHHMRVLETAGLVEGEARGKWMYYRLKDARGVSVP
jgi:ArsR family transcriptional regulator